MSTAVRPNRREWSTNSIELWGAMRIPTQRHEVRNLVIHTFRQNGAAVFPEPDMVESAMFDGGRCVAWSYRFGDLMAMWLIDVGLVQFYDAEGNMLQTIDLTEDRQPRRMAA